MIRQMRQHALASRVGNRLRTCDRPRVFAERFTSPGKEDDVAQFLVEAKAMVEAEPGTLTWFAFRLGPSSFRIFDAFNSEDDRQAHFHGKVREAIIARADELFAMPPVITPVDVMASKLPGV